MGAAMSLVDKHGRRMRKLRLSLLDACNLSCLYCMPDNKSFQKTENLLSREVIYHHAAYMVERGIEQIRITGGEPTLRDDYLDIIGDLSKLPLKKLSMTTNGVNLHYNLEKIYQLGCTSLNFSLDSLTAGGFKKITGRDHFSNVMNSIFRAKEIGFEVKVNMVVLRGLNDHEILDFAHFAGNHHIPVRFLEVMNIGVMNEKFHSHYFSADKIRSLLKTKYEMTGLNSAADSTAVNYRLSNGAQIGIIASESEPFCIDCSRLRLGSDGQYYACLFSEEGYKPPKDENLDVFMNKLINQKPMTRTESVKREMHRIGG